MSQGFTQHHFGRNMVFFSNVLVGRNNNLKIRRRLSQSGAGFTIVELLVVIAIIGVLASLGFTGYTTFRARTVLTTSTAMTAQALRQAVLNAQNGRRDSVWSVDISTTGTTMYAGVSYGSRIVGSEIQNQFPTGVSVSGPASYTFAKRTGRPITPGTTTLTVNTAPATINVNALGTVTN